MFKLRIGYLIAGITTGCILLLSFIWTLPDGKLHIVFCNVGQGDGAYIRFPDGRDMVVDGGPDDSILNCLGRHMPFWDRHIDMIVMTHPQKDHFEGLISLFERYSVDYFVRSDVDNTTDSYQKLQEVVHRKKIPVKFVSTGDRISVEATTLSFIWPSKEQIAKGPDAAEVASKNLDPGFSFSREKSSSVLGSQRRSQSESGQNFSGSPQHLPSGDLNDYCLVFFLRYGSFDAVFTGDADNRVEAHYTGGVLADNDIEVLKVPHHGSRTGMTGDFIAWLHPKLAVISVGKNHYGHPAKEALDLLASVGAKTLRTDHDGDVELISDGKHWLVNNKKNVVN